MYKSILALATTIMLINNTAAPATETTTETELPNYYPAIAVVTETNTETDCVTIMTLPDGNEWEFSGVEDWSGGDLAVCIFSDNGTPYYLEDDCIIPIDDSVARYVGYADGENDTSETGEKLLWFAFSSTYWDLTENY